MNLMRGHDEGRWKPQECYDGVPRRPARRTSMEMSRSGVGRWRSEGDMSGLFPPMAPCRGSPPQYAQQQKPQLNRWNSRPNVLRSDSLPFQPGRRDSYLSIDSDLDSSVLGCESSLASSAMNSRCSNVSVNSVSTPTFVAIPLQRLPLPVRHRGVEPIQRSYPSSSPRDRFSSQPPPTTTSPTKTLVLKLSAEASRNRKLSRSRSNQSALRKMSRAATERKNYHCDEGCVTLPDDWMLHHAETGSESGDTKCSSDLFADMEAAAEQQLKQLMASDVSESRTSPRNDTAKVA